MEVKAEVHDMSPLDASRYRLEHRNNPDLPIPDKLIPAHHEAGAGRDHHDAEGA